MAPRTPLPSIGPVLKAPSGPSSGAWSGSVSELLNGQPKKIAQLTIGEHYCQVLFKANIDQVQHTAGRIDCRSRSHQLPLL